MPGINSNRLREQDRRFGQTTLRRKEKQKNNKHGTNGKHYQTQNRLRDLLEKVRPRSMKPQQEIGTGVDFVFAGKKIDFKFCFGALGDNHISVRMQNNQLHNSSDWTMVCNERGDIMLINTGRIRDYAKMNAAVMKRNFVLNKGTYSIHKISLAEMLGEVKFNGNIRSAKSILKALQKMNRIENPLAAQQKKFAMAFQSRRIKTKAGQLLATWRRPVDRRIAPRTNRR